MADKAAIIHFFKGLISAPFTAFTPDGEVNVDIIPQYIDFLVSQGVKGAFVNGTTGEGISLNVQERKRIAEAWVKHGKNKMEVIIIHIGANSLKDAQELRETAPLLRSSVTSDDLSDIQFFSFKRNAYNDVLP